MKTKWRILNLLLVICLVVGLTPMTAFADGTGRGAATKAFVKAVFSETVETAGSDSRICAATVKDKRGDFELHYVYSSDSIWNVQLFNRVRDGLAEPYKSLIPILEKDDNHKKGFLFLSDTQYEDMDLDWSDPAAVAEALIPGSGTVTTEENTSSVFSGTSTDIFDYYFSDYSETVVEFINKIGESITPPRGANIIEAISSAAKGEPYYIVEDGITKECYDVVVSMHVSRISAYTAAKERKEITPQTPSTPSGGTVISRPTTSRIAGDDRFETAVKVADQLKKELGVIRFNAIVVAYSDDFADALSASAFAQENEAPVLVINENNEEYVKKYIEQNLVKGGKVYIMGGNAVVTERFEDSLSEFNVSRLGGADRYETNLLTLKQLNLSGKDTIIIASGLDYADALSASSTGLPIMIAGDKLTASQIEYLKTLGGDDTYYIAGGTAAVSSEVEKQLKSLNLGTINRLAGEDRYETSALIAETFYSKSTLAYIASGDDFPDGLTGGVLAGLSRDDKGAPLLFVNENNTNLASSYIEDAGVRTVKAIGGTEAISDETLKAVI